MFVCSLFPCIEYLTRGVVTATGKEGMIEWYRTSIIATISSYNLLINLERYNEGILEFTNASVALSVVCRQAIYLDREEQMRM